MLSCNVLCILYNFVYLSILTKSALVEPAHMANWNKRIEGGQKTRKEERDAGKSERGD